MVINVCGGTKLYIYFMKRIILYFLLFNYIIFNQEIYTEYLIDNQDTLDTFSYQIPDNYNSLEAHPLLVTFHQWGGNHNSNYSLSRKPCGFGRLQTDR